MLINLRVRVALFRRVAGVQGEEQEDAGGDGGRLPGHPEHVTTPCPVQPPHPTHT